MMPLINPVIVNYKLILLFFNEKKNYVCCLQLDYVNSSLTLLTETKFMLQTNESMCVSMKDNLHTDCIQYILPSLHGAQDIQADLLFLVNPTKCTKAYKADQTGWFNSNFKGHELLLNWQSFFILPSEKVLIASFEMLTSHCKRFSEQISKTPEKES